jgi:fibrillarin-like pre-rRNA processing protein
MNEILNKTKSDNVFSMSSENQKRLCTKNLVQATPSGTTISVKNEEYRIWDPFHSKLAAIILKGSSISIKKDASVLYLGAANGTTVSHVSDIVSEGTVFAVEFSPRAVQDLIKVSIPRKNLVPILADANKPSSYQNIVHPVDFIYQDIAQREQARIAIRNARLYLKKSGILVLIIKSRSIDSVTKTSLVFEKEINELKGIFDIMELIDLKPYHSDHMAVVARYLHQ